jgi:choline dehydrogenase
MASNQKASIATLFRSFLSCAYLYALANASQTSPSSAKDILGTSFGTPIDATYDYVIVGGGNAGLVLANRLSSGNHTVAVIEAGSFYEIDNGNVSQIPRYVWIDVIAAANPLIDWEFETEPEEGIGGAKMFYPRGKTLGGSSARNHMIYHRPTKGSLEKWAEDVGDEAYGWDNFQKYYDKSVTFHPADAIKRLGNSTPPLDSAGDRVTSGPVSISYANYVLPFTSWVLKATETMGLKQLPGYLDGDLIGSSWYTQTTDPKTMIRDSSETAYLRPALNRTNLVIHTSTMALRVMFKGKQAVGVACNTARKNFTLSARKEVILSAGAFQSPQLLMVSGIGPRALLQKFDIPVLVDAPGVGQGMEDHPIVGITSKILLQSSTILNTPAKIAAATTSFLRDGSGPLSSTGLDVFAWEKLPHHLLSNTTLASLNATPSDWPDVEYMTQDLYPGPPPDADDYVSISAVLVNTFSRGTVSLRSASMFDKPVIHTNFLTDPRDQDVTIASLRRAREIFSHAKLSPVVIPGGEVVPGSAVQTDAELLQYIRNTGRTISHASCTCKMGKESDSMAVVDSEGRVFGTSGLRVVDASAMPFLPPGHPMATVYALAERVAERILGESDQLKS